MNTGRRAGGWRIALAVLALAGAGCAQKYWTPTPEQRSVALEIARLAVLQHVSDQKDDADVQSLRYTPGHAAPTPVIFTVGDVSFTRYRNKLWGRFHEGRKLAIVVFADPSRLPDWETSESGEGFPARIVVAVDIEAGHAVEPVPFPLP